MFINDFINLVFTTGGFEQFEKKNKKSEEKSIEDRGEEEDNRDYGEINKRNTDL